MMMQASTFLQKIPTKRWLVENGFPVPKTLGLFRLQDLDLVLEDVEPIRAYKKKMVVKPCNARLSRGVRIIRRDPSGGWNTGTWTGTAARVRQALAKTVQIGEETSLCMLEEFVEPHEGFAWAQESDWPFLEKGKARPWSVDGVFDTSGRFVVLECNHKPGHTFKKVVP